jgi:hypothetical protein
LGNILTLSLPMKSFPFIFMFKTCLEILFQLFLK